MLLLILFIILTFGASAYAWYLLGWIEALIIFLAFHAGIGLAISVGLRKEKPWYRILVHFFWMEIGIYRGLFLRKK